MFRVYLVKDKFFYIQRNHSEDDIILVKYPPVGIPDKDAYAHAVVAELNRQYKERK